jgi:type IV pilus assembly protein PilC
MPTFTYVAVDDLGNEVEGVQKADDRAAAEIALYDRSLRDIRLTEKTSILQKEITAPRVKPAEVMHLSRQLAAFIRAGLPVLEAVITLGSEAGNTAIKSMMTEVEDLLRRGETLSDCFDRYPKIFPEYYRGILRSAELTGQLDTVLDQLATYLERDLEARRKVKSASIYPAIIAVMAVITVVVLAVFVMPQFKVFFSSLDAELPWTTSLLLGVTDFIGQWWYVLLGGLIALIVGVVLALRREPVKYRWHKLTLRLPVVGDAITYALVERFCRLMASMTDAGVNLSQALAVTTASIDNRVFKRALTQVGEQMLEGAGIAQPLAETRLFPTTATQMVRVGEETGSLDRQLEVAARYYERELDYKIKRVTALIEPIVIIVMGLVVGFVAVALVQAMYGVFTSINTPT